MTRWDTTAVPSCTGPTWRYTLETSFPHRTTKPLVFTMSPPKNIQVADSQGIDDGKSPPKKNRKDIIPTNVQCFPKLRILENVRSEQQAQGFSLQIPGSQWCSWGSCRQSVQPRSTERECPSRRVPLLLRWKSWWCSSSSWRYPPLLDGLFHGKSMIWGYPYFGNPPSKIVLKLLASVYLFFWGLYYMKTQQHEFDPISL